MTSEWTDFDEPQTGHAAVGSVVGTRNEDGYRPELVEIEYRKDGETRTALVVRVSSESNVEFDDADTVRFWTRDGTTVIIDELLATRPAGDIEADDDS